MDRTLRGDSNYGPLDQGNNLPVSLKDSVMWANTQLVQKALLEIAQGNVKCD
jgi:hypothetical protein